MQKIKNQYTRFIEWFHLFDLQTSVHPFAKFLNQNWLDLIHKHLKKLGVKGQFDTKLQLD